MLGADEGEGGVSQNENLLHNYVAIVLQAFYHCGIYDNLIAICTTTDEGNELNKKGKFLLKKIMFLSSYLLPEIPHFPSLINFATNFQTEDKVIRVRRNVYLQTKAQKLVKELSSIAMKSPFEISRQNELFGTNQVNLVSLFQLGQQDYSSFVLRLYDYFNQMSLGLPFSQVISSYLADLKVKNFNKRIKHYYDLETDEAKFN